MRGIIVVGTISLFVTICLAEKKLALNDLPAAVKATVESELKGGQIKSISKEETTMDSIPPAAKKAILSKVADGRLGMVELFNRGGLTMYEAEYTARSGRKHEVLVRADGTETKE